LKQQAVEWSKKNIFVRGTDINNVILKDIIVNSPTGELLEARSVGTTPFQAFLLSGPVMTDEQFEFVQEKRKHLNEWK